MTVFETFANNVLAMHHISHLIDHTQSFNPIVESFLASFESPPPSDNTASIELPLTEVDCKLTE
jgi:hypothetical protein